MPRPADARDQYKNDLFRKESVEPIDIILSHDINTTIIFMYRCVFVFI